jgi:hypothetical protein
MAGANFKMKSHETKNKNSIGRLRLRWEQQDRRDFMQKNGRTWEEIEGRSFRKVEKDKNGEAWLARHKSGNKGGRTTCLYPFILNFISLPCSVFYFRSFLDLRYVIKLYSYN